MNSFSALELQAVQAAKNQDWLAAIQINQQILDENESDVNAFMRQGVAYVQVDEMPKAKAAFHQVLVLDKSNTLAKKHLERIKNHQGISLSSLPSDEQFIEEPGKTKTVELHRLAGKDQLATIAIGQVCVLKPKSRYISVEVGKVYVGSLPEDLSSRISKLMKEGNEYACYIRSLSGTTCSIFIKETLRSKKNEFVNSFPAAKSQLSTLNDDMFLADDTVPFQIEDVPMQMVSTDDDEEKKLDSYQITEHETDEREREMPEADDSEP